MSDPALSTTIGSNAMGPDSSSTPTAPRLSPAEGSETPRPPGQSHTAASGSGIGGGSGRKIERSCNLCHRRKIRCDKKSPCSSCARGGFPCFYPQAGQPIRRVRKTTIADVASRISDLEKTLTAGVGREQLRVQRSPPVASSAADTPGLGGVSSGWDTGRSVYDRPPTAPSSGSHAKSPGDEILVRKGTQSQYFDEVLISRVIEEVR